MATLALSKSLNIHYLDINPEGSPTVLLLHGLGATSQSWQLQVPALVEAGCRVLAPDQRGFGQSSYPGQSSIAEMARDAAELLRHVSDEPAHVVGLSLGGTVALQLALEYPTLVQQLVLVNTSARFRPWRPQDWVLYAVRYLLLRSMTPLAQARMVARRTFPRPHEEELRQLFAAQILQANYQGYMATLRGLACFDVLPRLKEIRVPTLVVTGGQDNTVSPSIQQWLVDGIPGARQALIPDGGHALTIDQPEAFNRTLLEFLASGRPCAMA